MKLNLVTKIPPSVNKYLFPRIMGNGRKQYVRMVETPEVIRFKGKTTKLVRDEIRSQGWIMPDESAKLDVKIDYFFPRKGMDPNNFQKILFDVFTVAGVYFDDQAAKPQTGLVVIDKFNPRLEITVTISEQVGVFKSEKDRELFIIKNKDKFTERKFTSILKKLDEGRTTEETYFDDDRNIKFKEEI